MICVRVVGSSDPIFRVFCCFLLLRVGLRAGMGNGRIK